MKQKFTLAIAFVFLSICSYGQLLNISDDTVTYSNGDTITYLISGTYLDSIHNFYLDVENLGSATSDVKIRKAEMVIALGSENSYCWGAGCYPPMTNLSSEVSIAINTSEELKIEYKPKGNAATTLIRYAALDVNHLADSSWFYLHINPGVSAIDIAKSKIKVKSFPNPVSENLVIEYCIPINFTNTKIELLNVLGSLVESKDLEKGTAQVSFDVSRLQNGVYFYRILSDEGVLLTQKVVVNH